MCNNDCTIFILTHCYLLNTNLMKILRKDVSMGTINKNVTVLSCDLIHLQRNFNNNNNVKLADASNKNTVNNNYNNPKKDPITHLPQIDYKTFTDNNY